LGYKTYMAVDAVKGVGIPEGSVERALKLLEEAGVILVESRDLK